MTRREKREAKHQRRMGAHTEYKIILIPRTPRYPWRLSAESRERAREEGGR